MKKLIKTLAVLALLGFSIYFGYLTCGEVKPMLQSEAEKKAVKELVVVDDENTNDPYMREIDFAALKRMNPDICGWLYVPETSIDYPILKGSTDTAYLSRGTGGEPNALGSVFTYADADRELTDARTVLFAHNMLQYQMFGELRRFLDEDFLNMHKKFYVYTERRTMEFEVFSVFTCEETEDEMFLHKAETSSNEYTNLLMELENRNLFSALKKVDVEKDNTQQCFSLVTCYGSFGTTERLMVNGIVIREKYVLR